ncbi:DUF6207 family protein [Streptomyces zaomyceticus]
MGGRDSDRTTRNPGQPGVRLRFLDVRPARRRRQPAALDPLREVQELLAARPFTA